jgi:hypothetical protein
MGPVWKNNLWGKGYSGGIGKMSGAVCPGKGKTMIENYLNEQELADLAEYCKRMTFEDAYSHAECDGEYRKNKAYRYIGAVTNLQRLLSDLGFAPR